MGENGYSLKCLKAKRKTVDEVREREIVHSNTEIVFGCPFLNELGKREVAVRVSSASTFFIATLGRE
jgi:predicted PP-loop superfamily ATPase